MSLPTRSIRPRARYRGQKHSHGGVTIPTDIAYDQNAHQVTFYGGMPFVMDDHRTRTPALEELRFSTSWHALIRPTLRMRALLIDQRRRIGTRGSA